VSLRTHEAGPGGWARPRLSNRPCGAVAVDSALGTVFEASKAKALLGHAVVAADKLCPCRWGPLQGSLATPLLDSSLAATVRAMASAGVPDAVIDKAYMAALGGLTGQPASSSVAPTPIHSGSASGYLSTPYGAYDMGDEYDEDLDDLPESAVKDYARTEGMPLRAMALEHPFHGAGMSTGGPSNADDDDASVDGSDGIDDNDLLTGWTPAGKAKPVAKPSVDAGPAEPTEPPTSGLVGSAGSGQVSGSAQADATETEDVPAVDGSMAGKHAGKSSIAAGASAGAPASGEILQAQAAQAEAAQNDRTEDCLNDHKGLVDKGDKGYKAVVSDDDKEIELAGRTRSDSDSNGPGGRLSLSRLGAMEAFGEDFPVFDGRRASAGVSESPAPVAFMSVFDADNTSKVPSY